MTTPRVLPYPKLTERQLQTAVMDAMRHFGWSYTHFRPGMTKHGWKTPLEGDAGWPDIYAVRVERAVAIELKSDIGQLTLNQAQWLARLRRAGTETYLWRPSHWFSGEIEKTLA